MLEKIFHGSRAYWIFVIILLLLTGMGVNAYINQFNTGLILTGMSQDVNWGLYIAQFTFFVGVAASGVMVAIPLYLHDYQTYAPVVIFGEFMAVGAVLIALLMVLVDLGYPTRVFNVIFYPTPHSILFWDMCVLSSYLLVNLIIGWTTVGAERKGKKPAHWVHILAIISIPLAISIHTVTAFIYCGNPGRPLWSTAIIACRFLASAFAAGPSLLVLIMFIMDKFTTFHVTDKAVDSLAKTVNYGLIANCFFFMLEVFTAFYENSPEHMEPITYMFFGLDGNTQLVGFMWGAVILAFLGMAILLVKKWRRNKKLLIVALLCVFFACWLDKGINFVLAGFVPNTFGEVVGYTPTANEIQIIIGVFAIGALVITCLFHITVTVREKIAQPEAVAKAQLAAEESARLDAEANEAALAVALEAKAKADAEAKAKAEAEAKAKAEEEAKAKAEAEAKAQAEEASTTADDSSDTADADA